MRNHTKECSQGGEQASVGKQDKVEGLTVPHPASVCCPVSHHYLEEEEEKKLLQNVSAFEL